MKKRKTAFSSSFLVALLLIGVSAAQAELTTRPGAGETADCEACHGVNGCVPMTGLMPKLCGQSKEYLLMTLVQFQDGSRPSPIMREATKGLSEDLLEQLADFFARAKGK
jgi:sulfide dehydrogenase cytochrome subunit